MKDRVIAQATFDSGTLQATMNELRWSESDVWQSLAWSDIARATWSSETNEFVVEPVQAQRRTWILQDAGQLPEAARERITSTIIAQEQITVAGVGRVLVIFRRAGERIEVQLQPPVDPALVREQIRRVQADLGIG